jgi:hypothetical protein
LAVTATGVCGVNPFSTRAEAASARWLEHDRAGGCGERGPVHVATDVDLGVRATERDTGVGGHRGAGRDTGDDVEHGTGAGDGLHLGNGGRLGQRVTGDEPEHQPAGLGLGCQVLGDFGGLADGRPYLGVGAGEGQYTGGHIRIGYHDLGLGEQLLGADRQKPGVARARAHEGDTPCGLTRGGHLCISPLIRPFWNEPADCPMS